MFFKNDTDFNEFCSVLIRFLMQKEIIIKRKRVQMYWDIVENHYKSLLESKISGKTGGDKRAENQRDTSPTLATPLDTTLSSNKNKNKKENKNKKSENVTIDSFTSESNLKDYLCNSDNKTYIASGYENDIYQLRPFAVLWLLMKKRGSKQKGYDLFNSLSDEDKLNAYKKAYQYQNTEDKFIPHIERFLKNTDFTDL